MRRPRGLLIWMLAGASVEILLMTRQPTAGLYALPMVIFLYLMLAAVDLLATLAVATIRRRLPDWPEIRRSFEGPSMLLRASRESPDDILPALATAVASTLVLVLAWQAVREWSLVAGDFAVTGGAGWTRESIRRDWHAVAHIGYWRRLWTWEAWSLSRWWVFFDGLTVLVLLDRGLRGGPGGRGRCGLTLQRLLRFTPWLIVLELGFLVGVYYARRAIGVVPEPGTFFTTLRYRPTLFAMPPPFWMDRSTVPLLIVATAYFRSVARWPWVVSLACSAVLVPAGILLSMYWSAMFLAFRWFE